MEWLLLALAGAGGAGAYAARRAVAFRADHRRHAVELEQVRAVADEDVTVFGEQLRRLGESLVDRDLGLAAREDYQVALDAYEHAKREAPRLSELDQISGLVDTLATGRYAMACVRARADGEPVPELRVPCFFNPQHGPSTRNVMWTSARTGTRNVPACIRCATQVAAREEPEVRMIQIGSRRVPYWEAGAAFHPYSKGYFPEGAIGVTMTWMYVASPVEGFPGSAGDHGGGLGGSDGGGFDGGGFDGGGVGD